MISGVLCNRRCTAMATRSDQARSRVVKVGQSQLPSTLITLYTWSFCDFNILSFTIIYVIASYKFNFLVLSMPFKCSHDQSVYLIHKICN